MGKIVNRTNEKDIYRLALLLTITNRYFPKSIKSESVTKFFDDNKIYNQSEREMIWKMANEIETEYHKNFAVK